MWEQVFLRRLHAWFDSGKIQINVECLSKPISKPSDIHWLPSLMLISISSQSAIFYQGRLQKLSIFHETLKNGKGISGSGSTIRKIPVEKLCLLPYIWECSRWRKKILFIHMQLLVKASVLLIPIYSTQKKCKGITTICFIWSHWLLQADNVQEYCYLAKKCALSHDLFLQYTHN